MLNDDEQLIASISKFVGNGLVLRQAEGFYLDCRQAELIYPRAQVVVRFLSLGTPKRLFKGNGSLIDVTSEDALVVSSNTGTQGPEGGRVNTFSAAQLAAYGVALDTERIFEIFTDGSQLVVNGVEVPFSSSVLADTYYIGLTPNHIGSRSGAMEGDFALFELRAFHDGPVSVALLRKAYNQGVGSNVLASLGHVIRRRYIFTRETLNVNTYRFNSSVKTGSVKVLKQGAVAEYEDNGRLFYDDVNDFLEFENSANETRIANELTLCQVFTPNERTARQTSLFSNYNNGRFTFAITLGGFAAGVVLGLQTVGDGRVDTPSTNENDFIQAGRAYAVCATAKVGDQSLCKMHLLDIANGSGGTWNGGVPGGPLNVVSNPIRFGSLENLNIYLYGGFMGHASVWNIALTAAEKDYIFSTAGGTKDVCEIPAVAPAAFPRIYHLNNPNLLYYVTGRRAGGYDLDLDNLADPTRPGRMKNWVLNQPNVDKIIATRRGSVTTIPAP